MPTGPDHPDADSRNHRSSEYTGDATEVDVLATRLSGVARDLQRREGPDDALVGIVRGAIDVIPGAAEASISLVLARREVTSQAPSSALAATVDHIQDEVGEGPCLDAVYEQQTVRVTDMRTEQRWPRFASRAHEAGVGAMLSFQLYVEGDNLGALNLYAGTPGAFDDESEQVGLLFAAHAAIAYAAARRQSQLDHKVATRELIGQAQGILMERHRLRAEQAFALLVRISQHRNTKLRDVAEQLVRTGQLELPPPDRTGPG